MNALEMLLQRIRAPGAPDPAWQAHLAELERAALPPQDQVLLAPGSATAARVSRLADEGYLQPEPQPSRLVMR